MENMDYIHGCGICAILEGETVLPDEECICPKKTYEETEAFLKVNRKKTAGRGKHRPEPAGA